MAPSPAPPGDQPSARRQAQTRMASPLSDWICVLKIRKLLQKGAGHPMEMGQGGDVEMVNTSEVQVNAVVDGEAGQRGMECLNAAFVDVLR